MRRKNHQKKEDYIYFSKKEKIMLDMLLKDGRTFNTNIARRLKISSQVTGRIRKELEKKGIIQDYSVDLNNYYFNLKTFNLVIFNIKDPHKEKIMTPNLFGLYKIIANSATHLALYSFKNLEESENFFNSLVEYSEFIKIKEHYTFPLESIIKQFSNNIYYNALDNFNKNIIINKYKLSSIGKNKNYKSLTITEEKVLIELVKNSRISSKKISSNLKINLTRTGVSKIKKRLEDKGIINKYNLNLNYEKLGINILAFVILIPQLEAVKCKEELIKKCLAYPNSISCYKLNDKCAIFCGFKNLNELENYCEDLRLKSPNLVKIQEIYIISPRGVIKESFRDLYLSLLEERPKD